MAQDAPKESAPMLVISQYAQEFPEVEIGTSCVNRSFKARKKAFLYMGMNDSEYNFRLKLSDSLAEAQSMAEKNPDNCSVGMHGWVHITMPHSKSLPKRQLKKWISESFGLLATKKTTAKKRVNR